MAGRKNWGALGCAAFAGAALAFPLGVVFGGRDAIDQNDRPEARRDESSAKANGRQMYSPKIYDDPYVQDKWRKQVEALETQCRESGEHCSEARAARRWLSQMR